MASIIIGVLVVIGLIALFVYSWKANHKTAIPDGAFVETPKCSGCANTGCGNYKKPN